MPQKVLFLPLFFHTLTTSILSCLAAIVIFWTIKSSKQCCSACPESSPYIYRDLSSSLLGAGIAQWLEHRTRDWKVAGSNPCWNSGRIFFSRVDFLCWLLFRYPFHPRVTTVARKKSRSFCQKCRWQVTAKHAYTLRMLILLNRASVLVTTCP